MSSTRCAGFSMVGQGRPWLAPARHALSVVVRAGHGWLWLAMVGQGRPWLAIARHVLSVVPHRTEITECAWMQRGPPSSRVFPAQRRPFMRRGSFIRRLLLIVRHKGPLYNESCACVHLYDLLDVLDLVHECHLCHPPDVLELPDRPDRPDHTQQKQKQQKQQRAREQ